MTTKRSRVLIVGASAAGMATASALRRRGHDGEIVMLGAEPYVPYDRPPLSKQYQTDDWTEQRLRLVPDARLAQLDLDLRLGVPAVALNVDAHTVTDAAGTEHPYDEVVIATGLAPRRLNSLAHVEPHELRTLDDAQRLKRAIVPGAKVAIVGAGFIGLESAATSRELGADVTVIEPSPAPLANRVGAGSADKLLDLHRQRGVKLMTGVTVDSAARTAGRVALTLSNGVEVVVDEVLVSVGAAPNTQWLEGSGLNIENGVTCDEYSRAAQGVWAAGDVARWYHMGYGRHMRIEHRTNATEQGQQVAAGIHGELSPYMPVPFFWTDHFGSRLQVAGPITPELVESPVDIGDRENAHLSLFHDGETLRAALAWNAPRDLNPYRQELTAMFREGRRVA